MSERPKEKKLQRWYFGGIASAAAACLTHPLELIKVVSQSQETGEVSLVKTTKKIIKQDGFLRLYNGISAAIVNELMYSTARFGIYHVGKQYVPKDSGFGTQILLAGTGGAIGTLIGVPSSVINVRMENDMKCPLNKRRCYKHLFDGFVRVSREEGIGKLFSGAGPALFRGALLTVGQVVSYDQIKSFLLLSDYFKDDAKTYFVASVGAGTVATVLTHPMDVLKTRGIIAKYGEYKSFSDIMKHTAKLGPLSFYKGFFPAFARLAPNTIITFLFLEILSINFGYIPD